MKVFGFALAAAFMAATGAQAMMGSLQVVVVPPLVVVFTPPTPVTLNCPQGGGAPGNGTVVTALSTTGGDGQAVAWSITAGDSTDFAISGTNVVVKAGNALATDCAGTMNVTHTVTVTATQP